MTALVGESGSGKSTIIDLLLGLQIPIKGEVLLDNIPLSDWKQNSFREKVGYIPQDPILFNTSIRNNLLWSKETANEEELYHSLELANAKFFVQQLPMGIDTIVGDRGVLLSGGQRQRIALARALLRQPEILILDEATSSLDTESEKSIKLSIDTLSKKMTILIVAHRLSTISSSDYVYVLQTGQVVEEGQYKDLASNLNSIFSFMLMNQSKD
jgi:ABC-type multidrug transport system fused ATPase/permease subunit